MLRKLSLGALIVLLASTALAVPKGGPQYQTDTGTVEFLRRNLIAGGDIHYPLAAAKAKQQGSAFYLMKLGADGSVESLALKRSTGYKALDEHVARTLKAYRFKPRTKNPMLWLVSFAQPTTVIVKVYVGDEKDLQVPSWL